MFSYQVTGLRAFLLLSASLLRAQSDTNPPNVANVVITPTEINVSAASGQVVVHLTINDDLSGFDWGWVGLKSPSGNQSNTGSIGPTPATGNLRSGVFKVNISIPQSAEAGNWIIYGIALRDIAGNVAYIESDALQARKLMTGVKVLSQASDTVPPSLASVLIVPLHVNVSSLSQQVAVNLAISDDKTGFNWGWVGFSSPSGKQSVFGSIDPIPVSGTRQSGVFRGNVTFPQAAESGSWTIAMALHDFAGNIGIPQGADLQTRGIVTKVDVLGQPRTDPAVDGTGVPYGIVDTPSVNAAVAGAVGVTGWALDDVEVTKIEVWRKSVPGEPNYAGRVYIGDGIFLDGARPDVGNTYPQAPFRTRAGWGMQILTNTLPNAAGFGPLGNGQHQLFVYAFDKNGNATLLMPSPVINVNNATATKPFGTLDTPQSGATTSGLVTVFGWALTPRPAVIPLDGSTLWVFVDGIPLGHPVYNLFRSDVSGLFPGLQNSSGPVGYYYLDTTKLANGLHSIAWSVTDNQNRIEGIGSRLFWVQNSTSLISPTPLLIKGSSNRSAARNDVWLRTGYDPYAQLEPATETIEIEQSGRLELHLPLGVASVEFQGNTSPPVGSTFDAQSGVFYWQLNPAFIASYVLVFRDVQGLEMYRIRIVANQQSVATMENKLLQHRELVVNDD